MGQREQRALHRAAAKAELGKVRGEAGCTAHTTAVCSLEGSLEKLNSAAGTQRT